MKQEADESIAERDVKVNLGQGIRESVDFQKFKNIRVVRMTDPVKIRTLNSTGREFPAPCSSQERSVFSPLPKHKGNVDESTSNVNIHLGRVPLKQTEETFKFYSYQSPCRNEPKMKLDLSDSLQQNFPNTPFHKGLITKTEVLTPPMPGGHKGELRSSAQIHAMSSKRGIYKVGGDALFRNSPRKSSVSKTVSKRTASKLKSSHDIEKQCGRDHGDKRFPRGSISENDVRKRHYVLKEQWDNSSESELTKTPNDLLMDTLDENPVRNTQSKVRNKRKLFNNDNFYTHMPSIDSAQGSSESPGLNTSRSEDDPLCIFIKEYISSGDNESSDSDFSSSKSRRKRVPFGRLLSGPRRELYQDTQSLSKATPLRKVFSDSRTLSTSPNSDADLSSDINNQNTPKLVSESVAEKVISHSAVPGNSVETNVRETLSCRGDAVSDSSAVNLITEETFPNNDELVRMTGALSLSTDITQQNFPFTIRSSGSPPNEADIVSEQSARKTVNNEVILSQNDDRKGIKNGRSSLSTRVPEGKFACRMRPSRKSL